MSHVALRISMRRTLAAAILLLLALAGAPAAAVAAFTGTGSAAPRYSAASLPAPSAAATNVTFVCLRHGNDITATITVVAYGTVPQANYHQITITPPTGAVVTGDLSQLTGRTFAYAFSRKDSGPVEWTYEIQGQYKVPGTTNVWSGTPLAGTLTCN